MSLSRRDFLKITGVWMAGVHAGALPSMTFADGAPVRGRVLDAVTVGGQPLWPDTVVTILDADGARYRLPAGWVERAAIQPMYVDAAPLAVWSHPADAEVHAPAVAIRRYASADAPLLARAGHGSVFHVADTLPDSAGQTTWLYVSGPGVSGWVQAAHCRPAELPASTITIDKLRLDTEQQRLDAYAGDTLLLSSPVSTSIAVRDLRPVSLFKSGPACHYGDDACQQAGVPWPLASEDGWLLAGATWHNRFGTPQPGPSIQLSPAVARWLYANTGDRVSLAIG